MGLYTSEFKNLFHLVPECEKEQAILHMLVNSVMDLRYRFGLTCYSPDFVSCVRPLILRS